MTMTPAEAVQEHLEIEAQVKALTARKKILKEAVMTAMDEDGVKFIAGTNDDHGLKLVETVRWTMDTTAAKEELGDAWVTAHSKHALVTSLRLSREE